MEPESGPASTELAPCVAIVGPPNSGKSTLLNLLDEALQLHPARPAVYVVKGNPDGSGRYIHYSPELREGLKANVKGKWVESTVDQICEWTANARRHLGLVLLDWLSSPQRVVQQLLVVLRQEHTLAVDQPFLVQVGQSITT